MHAKLTHCGYFPRSNEHCYMAFFDNGHVDMLMLNQLVGEDVDLPDDLWSEGSGWGDFECEDCGEVHRTRCRPGSVVACPWCGTPELVPEEAALESSNMED